MKVGNLEIEEQKNRRNKGCTMLLGFFLPELCKNDLDD